MKINEEFLETYLNSNGPVGFEYQQTRISIVYLHNYGWIHRNWNGNWHNLSGQLSIVRWVYCVRGWFQKPLEIAASSSFMN